MNSSNCIIIIHIVIWLLHEVRNDKYNFTFKIINDRKMNHQSEVNFEILPVFFIPYRIV